METEQAGFGGFGGTGGTGSGGNTGAINVSNAGTITTVGDGSHGIFVIAQGGTGFGGDWRRGRSRFRRVSAALAAPVETPVSTAVA